MTAALVRPAAARLGLLALLLASPAEGLQEPPVRRADPPAAEDAACAEIVAALRSGLPPEQAGQRLARVGPSVLPLVFQTLADQRPPAATTDRGEPDVLAWTPEVELTLLVCARGLGRDAIGPFLDARMETDFGEREQVAALELLGEVGRGPELALAARVAAGGSGDPTDSVRAALQAAVAAVLVREPACLVQLGPLIHDSKPSACRSAFLRAVEAVPAAVAVSFLGELLLEMDRDDELARALLGELGRAASRVLTVDDERLFAKVRSHLREGTSVPLLREAALAAGRLGDDEAVPRLVELLEHEEHGVRDACRWSLTRLTGLELAEDPEPWRRWLAEEQRWFESREPTLAAQLERGEAGDVARVLNELARHRLHRSRLSREASRGCSHPSPDVRRLACSAMAQLDRCNDLRVLIALLDDRAPAVRSEAWNALRSLTGWRLPADAYAWSEALREGGPGAAEEELARDEIPRRTTSFSRL